MFNEIGREPTPEESGKSSVCRSRRCARFCKSSRNHCRSKRRLAMKRIPTSAT